MRPALTIALSVSLLGLIGCTTEKAAASTDGTTAHKYLSGQRDYAKLFTDPDLIAILDDKHPDGGLLYVFSDYSSVVCKPSATN